MKRNFLTSIAFAAVFFASANASIQPQPVVVLQTNLSEKVFMYTTQEKVVDNALVDVPARFPGGRDALIKYVFNHLAYPEVARNQELQGTCVLRFKIGTDGAVSDVTVRKSLSRECDQAAIKTVRALPRFIPARSQGHPVPVWYTLPVRFKIQ